MASSRILLFLLSIILQSVALSFAQQPMLLSLCSNANGNFTTNSTYQENLNNLLSSISSNTEIDYGFYNTSNGRNADQVNAIALCRGDINPNTCRSCITNSTRELTSRCPNQKEAIIWYDNCMLRYSNRTIFGKLELRPSIFMYSRNNVTGVNLFNQAVRNLLDSLKNQAASGGSLRKFATGSANGPSSQTIYALVQCTSDLSEQDCVNCLNNVTAVLPTCCDGRQGGRVLAPSCNFRYEKECFYNVADTAPTPSPSLSPAASGLPLLPSPSTTTPRQPPPPPPDQTESSPPQSATQKGFWYKKVRFYDTADTAPTPPAPSDLPLPPSTSTTTPRQPPPPPAQTESPPPWSATQKGLQYEKERLYDAADQTEPPPPDGTEPPPPDGTEPPPPDETEPPPPYETEPPPPDETEPPPPDGTEPPPPDGTEPPPPDETEPPPPYETEPPPPDETEPPPPDETEPPPPDETEPPPPDVTEPPPPDETEPPPPDGTEPPPPDGTEPPPPDETEPPPPDGTNFIGGIEPPPPPTPLPQKGNGGNSARTVHLVVVVIGLFVVVIIFPVVSITTLCVCVILRRRNQQKKNEREGVNEDNVLPDRSLGLHSSTDEHHSMETHCFSFSTIQAATNNFSDKNKLGEGGFGPVYKGQLPNGNEIAVKRLSMRSAQGLEEFKTEVNLLIKVQHKNLVRLLGYCLESDEKLLVYEFMAKSSLDTFLFDPTKSKQLNWDKRVNIIKGTARGLLYLHEDSRLKIIHRDLKASNVLLDDELNPNISDFGTARIFGSKQMEANTQRIVGTYGYIAPEYGLEGLFSIKSDVYSFGILVLEIISGKQNRGICDPEHGQNLLLYGWRLWNEGNGEKFVDPNIVEACDMSEALRWIHIALLCVQDDPADRPTMSSVVLMLASKLINLPQPSTPPYSAARFTKMLDQYEISEHEISTGSLTGFPASSQTSTSNTCL